VNELNIHIRLKEARKYLGLNQQMVANDLDIKQKTVSEIENGKIMNIPNKYIYYFYDKGISLEWMYSGKGNMIIEKNIEETEDKQVPDDFVSKEIPFVQFPENEIINKKLETIEPDTLNLLLSAKDENLRSLTNYIKSQEKMILFLQEIIRKELKL